MICMWLKRSLCPARTVDWDMPVNSVIHLLISFIEDVAAERAFRLTHINTP